jgi:hypothetical protein
MTASIPIHPSAFKRTSHTQNIINEYNQNLRYFCSSAMASQLAAMVILSQATFTCCTVQPHIAQNDIDNGSQPLQEIKHKGSIVNCLRRVFFIKVGAGRIVKLVTAVGFATADTATTASDATTATVTFRFPCGNCKDCF